MMICTTLIENRYIPLIKQYDWYILIIKSYLFYDFLVFFFSVNSLTNCNRLKILSRIYKWKEITLDKFLVR